MYRGPPDQGAPPDLALMQKELSRIQARTNPILSPEADKTLNWQACRHETTPLRAEGVCAYSAPPPPLGGPPPWLPPPPCGALGGAPSRAPPLQATLAQLPLELAAQEERVAAVHARLAAQATTILAGIAGRNSAKYTISNFMQHCVLPRISYSPQVSPKGPTN